VGERIADADVVVINKIKMNESNLKHADKVKLICLAATGYDNVDTAYCREKGIAVCNVVGYSTQSVAQVTVAMALSLCTKLSQYRQFVMSGEYSRQPMMNRLEPIYHEIAGKTWGIVGFGNIGRQVASVAEALGCRVIVNKRTPVEEYPLVDIDIICREADILSVHTPLSAETRGLISAQRIASMKKDAILINVARGAVIDETAAAKAILEGRLGGLGVDVYSTEPFPVEHPYTALLDCENVCLTPHMAWGAHEARVRCLEEIAANIRAFFAGEVRCRVD
jgi:glycerate dehydrogenase